VQCLSGLGTYPRHVTSRSSAPDVLARRYAEVLAFDVLTAIDLDVVDLGRGPRDATIPSSAIRCFYQRWVVDQNRGAFWRLLGSRRFFRRELAARTRSFRGLTRSVLL
jgi:hypothetical protein